MVGGCNALSRESAEAKGRTAFYRHSSLRALEEMKDDTLLYLQTIEAMQSCGEKDLGDTDGLGGQSG